jgi:hypothetical protein
MVFEVVSADEGMSLLDGADPVAPPLLWPEVRSALHVERTRRVLSEDDSSAALDALESGAVRERRHRRLGREAWRIADAMGWARSCKSPTGR